MSILRLTSLLIACGLALTTSKPATHQDDIPKSIADSMSGMD